MEARRDGSRSARRRRRYPRTDGIAAKTHDPRRKAVKTACNGRLQFDNHSNDCNAFLKAVANDLAIIFFQTEWNADAIISNITVAAAATGVSNWRTLGSPSAAKEAADTGDFVVAGTTGAQIGQTNGHVAIVVSGALDPKRLVPRGYWGKLNSVGCKNSTLNYSWNPDNGDLDAVQYWGFSRT